MAPDKDDSNSVNERLADEVQREWTFTLKRLPINIVARLGIIPLTLVLLELMLIVSNIAGPFGYWAAFIQRSTRYRDGFNRKTYDQTNGGLDFTRIASWHLWRGFVVPSFLGCCAYSITAVLCLRHELYHWKPELLAHYGQVVHESSVGSWIPMSWLNFFFEVYKKQYLSREDNRIQPGRKHAALKDMVEFRRVLRQVGVNLFVSIPSIFIMWMVFLNTKIGAGDQDMLKLPRSYVPPVQGVAWYLINDLFYFYPHWIAHSPALADPTKTNIPGLRPVLIFLHKRFKSSHRLHHRCKANIGIAAWYCSVWEQLIFNLFPALAGPVITQMLADAAGLEQIWGTHLVTLYIWIIAAAASSVLAHTGYRSMWHDPGKHDLHHEHAFDPKNACNFGTFGFFDWLHGTKSNDVGTVFVSWRELQDRQAALLEASKRSGVPLTQAQLSVVKQPEHDQAWARNDI